MSDATFTDDELRRFGKFLEAFGLRLQGDAEFRRLFQGRPEEVEVESLAAKPEPLNVEFSDAGEDVIATISLPPGVRREDVKLNVSRDAVEVTLRGRLITLATPMPVEAKHVRATYRNHVLDVTMRKARALP